MSLEEQMIALGRDARAGAEALRRADAAQRSAAIRAMAVRLREHAPQVLAANAADLAAATRHHDRLMLDSARFEAIATALEDVAALPDPVGAELARWKRPNGLDIARVRTPIGVIGMIYEARPNVTADAAAICVRSGNAVILRPGSDCFATSQAIHGALAQGLEDAGLPASAVQIVPTTDRAAVGALLEGLGGNLDLVIPRGGKSLVERVQAEARVPVLGHLEGVCHTYVHEAADAAKAAAIVANAKLRRVSVCGATETLLIDRAALPMLPAIAEALRGCELRGDAEAAAIVPMLPAHEADWGTEYLAPVLSIRTVSDWRQAAAHIARYGTGHTEAIITEDADVAESFLGQVDSAIVLWNASTQFADGGEFGFGAEIGIATGKLHARGPVGPDQLTSFKYVVRGSGQTRS
ncbi:glutamate-5-semialdehyde dehydrogenase [Sphingomonas astaxanthinifaciens]|uniref:Gamma-glutamyl phosphate reductase n=1 Tax=Sphingomonas astaxanthinifaciens DSM 22298 TaxID=1123267 RepID=A0ABQ5Z840_9SPHN|nr:glutamate-5-semialdehyde dehydrogenase [Sphingomonas astaxanthinifaciens]GLR47712.1 gamma-glutamyl phosphate reductase [Sphingomonas astaxanthinifaciens DSM 22298]